ncbi:CAP-Gly domain-containing linker protein 3-like isoform X3 [Acropora palmata]|uniref:CAP-Gly domain-containing linker protein 3-like isoform X3 n=1 Tax=Acropora palmata TaxID=6131 RepID=UPI003DA0DCDC
MLYSQADFEMEVDTNDEEDTRRRFESSLPENWVLCSSKTHTGRFYYFNSVTGESRWEHPLIPDMDSSEKTADSSSGFVVTDFIMPAREKPVSHPPSDPPLCESCKKLELTFFDPNCPDCQGILLEPKTTISEIFAIMRQWVPQVQQNIEMLINEILRRGAHIDDRDGLTDMTLLHYACKSGAVGVGDVSAATNMVNKLISKGSDISQKCRWTDMLPLHYASFFDAAAILRVLLKASNARDVNVPCKEFDNGTSLHIAASNLCLEGAKCLLQHGADASVKDKLSRVALHCIPDVSGYERDSEPVILAEKMTRLLSEAEPPAKTAQDQENEVPQSLISMGVKIGDQVCIGGNKLGILRFCGQTDFASGEWAGVELDSPVGKNDGSVGGVVYFHCQPKHGIFAPLSKVTRADSAPSTRPSSRPTSASRIAHSQISQSSSQASSRSNSTPGSRSNSPVPMSQVNGMDETLGFQIGDGVTVAGQKSGIIRFIGRTQFSTGVWLGIELDQPVGKNDGSVSGIRYFDCKPSHGVFAPPSKVTRTGNHSQRGFAIPSVPVGKGRFGSQSSLQASQSGSHGSQSDLSQTDSNPELNGSGRKLSSQSSPDHTPRRGSSSDKSSTLRRGSLPQQKAKSSAEFQLTEGLSVLVNGELGVVRFIGTAEFAEGIWLGVEMRKPVGKNDGSVNGKKYFTCKPQHGLMVRPSRVTCRGINCAKLINEVES